MERIKKKDTFLNSSEIEKQMPDIIADFHGTLYRDENEGPLWRHVAKQAIKPAEILQHPVRTVAFWKAKPALEELAERYKRGEIGYDQIYRAYNELVLSHLPVSFVRTAIEGFAALPETKQKLDSRVLGPISQSPGRKGILSTGSRDFISYVLRDGIRWDAIQANRVLGNGKGGSRFELDVYGNKPQKLQVHFFSPHGFNFDPRQTVYLGDNADEEPAFEYVRSMGGKVVIPFYATDAFKQRAATEYKAEVPKDQEELSRFLRSLK